MLMYNKYFSDVYTHPEMISENHIVTEVSTVHKYMKAYQTIKLNQDEMVEFAKDKDSWFYESDAEMYNELENMDDMYNGDEFNDVTNGSGISEYFTDYEKYFPLMDYLQYTKKHHVDIFIAVYNSKNDDSEMNYIIGNKTSDELYNQMIPDFKFKIPENIKYNYFSNSKYENNVFISCFRDPIQILSVNLPYEIYDNIVISPIVYTWDIIGKKHKFGYMNEFEFNELVDDICTNGITEPIIMRLDNGILYPIDNNDNLIIFIAKLFNIPFIPVTIFISNDDSCKNYLIEAMIYNEKDKSKIYEYSKSLNKVLNPFIIITKPNEDFSKYPEFYKYSIASSNEYVTVRFFNSITSRPNVIRSDVPCNNNELQNNAIELLNKHVKEAFESTIKEISEGE